MRFKLTKCSDWNFEEEIDISSLEDLMEFISKNGQIVLSKGEIEIYDDYRE